MSESATETTPTPALGRNTGTDTDILIVGAGPVGVTLALALANSPWRVRLVDRQPAGAWQKDPRALALSHGSRQLLERLDAWNTNAATPIERIHISQRGGFGRTRLTASDHGLPALGYVMRYRALLAALHARLDAALLTAPCLVKDITPSEGGIGVTLESGSTRQHLSAKLVVHAEGTPADEPGIRVRDYGQHAIVCEVTPAEPHGHRAWERFTPDGPLALLPVGADYAVVFTVPPEKVAAILKLNDKDFLAVLNAQFGQRVRLIATGPRASFPLALRLRKQLARERQVWLGNAAQTLHPVSGQGFNLGLRDAWELAETLLDGGADDPGRAAPLATYARHRQVDRWGGALFTDGLIHAFSNDIPPLRALRGLGLLALDAVPPLRSFVAGRMIWGARAWF